MNEQISNDQEYGLDARINSLQRLFCTGRRLYAMVNNSEVGFAMERNGMENIGKVVKEVEMKPTKLSDQKKGK